MENILSDQGNLKDTEKQLVAPKTTLQMLAAAKPRIISPPPITPVTPVSTNSKLPVSPVKNFQKVTNTITKEAIPAGIFKSGKVKQLYDVLYSLTRGAFNPSRTVKISKPKLQTLSAIGSPQTLNAGLMHLQLVGLLSINAGEGGTHEGHEYEVFLFEETQGKVTGVTGVTDVRNLPPLPSFETNARYGGLNDGKHTTYQEAKTLSLKTNTKDDDDDDSATAGLLVLSKKLNEATKKVTGKHISKNEAEKWGSLADLLILELEKAAKNTNSISSVPAFLTEVLRRQFFASNQTKSKTPKNTVKTSGRAKPDLVGKSSEESFEIKPLDRQGREEALAQLMEFADDDFLIDFEKWYTAEDWQWLTKQLK